MFFVRRVFFQTAAAVSFMLLVCVCVLWVRANWSWDRIAFYENTHRFWDCEIRDGRVELARYLCSPATDERTGAITYEAFTPDDFALSSYGPIVWDEHWSAFGFEYGWVQTPQPMMPGHWFVAAPLWVVAGLLAILPFMSIIKGTRRRAAIRRAASGRCPRCGYDLRFSPCESCPECGAKRWIDSP